MTYKFDRLEVWRLALEYTDMIYAIVEQLPRDEAYNLRSQITRAATSIALNIAEGSTSQSDAEQARFLSYTKPIFEDRRRSAVGGQRSYFEGAEQNESIHHDTKSSFR